LLVVVQSTFIISNMFRGLLWFILPVLLIVSNDVWAYFFGFFWGRTPLIKLSPKKTWEGFIGGFVMTVITGFLLSRFLSWFDLMICPQEELTFRHPHCDLTLPFIVEIYHLPASIASWLPSWLQTVSIAPIQWHGVNMAIFASIIAPFGGFFASGFKRAFKFKDFGDSIPGHGGVTDRMDCQVLMGLFVYVYYGNFVQQQMDIGTVLRTFLLLTQEDQVACYRVIAKLLATRGALPVDVLAMLLATPAGVRP